MAEQKKTSPVYEKYPELYHYTTMAGAIGIIETQSLWATHFKKLNDSTEFYFSRDLLIEHVSTPAMNDLYTQRVELDEEKMKEENVTKEELISQAGAHMVDIFYKGLGLDDLFITSFCTGHSEDEYSHHNGLLSQWRGYGSDGGCIIVFDTKKLVELLDAERTKYGISGGDYEVFYGDDPALLETQEFSEYVDALKKYIESIAVDTLKRLPKASEEQESLVNDGVLAIFKMAGAIKHYGFHEEKEVRFLLFNNNKDKAKKVEYREGQDMIPYIVLFDDPDITLPIKRVIIGPHKDCEQRARDLQRFIRDKLKTEIEIIISKTPYLRN